MPELPEVETTRRGVAPHCLGRKISGVLVRESRLRWPLPARLPAVLVGQAIEAVERRAKYLLFRTQSGTLMVHLGMSGSLRVVDNDTPPITHDHVDFQLDSGSALRYHDPRRFGSVHWIPAGDTHPLLSHLGLEPLLGEFDGGFLYRRSRGRKGPIKHFIMDAKVVVGIGNIYANEALFLAGIRPDRAAGRVSLVRYERLAEIIKQVLTNAINHGGTTLRDFVGGDGRPGYFAQKLYVYGRAGEPCKRCERPLREARLGQRTSVYCVTCQR